MGSSLSISDKVVSLDYLSLLGVEFAYGGRGPDAYDCYGLVMEIHRRLGVELPDYRSPDVLEDIAGMLAVERKYRWREVATRTSHELIPMSVLKPGRVIEIRMKGHACHVGFIHKPRWFLHTYETSGGVVQNEIESWRNRIIGVYEYAGEDFVAEGD